MLAALPSLDATVLEVNCPTCGAGGQMGPDCRRCRCDLRLMLRVERERVGVLKEVATALADQRWCDALASAQFLHTLRQDDVSFHVLAVCHLLNRLPAAAFDTYRQHVAQSNATQL